MLLFRINCSTKRLVPPVFGLSGHMAWLLPAKNYLLVNTQRSDENFIVTEILTTSALCIGSPVNHEEWRLRHLVIKARKLNTLNNTLTCFTMFR